MLRLCNWQRSARIYLESTQCEMVVVPQVADIHAVSGAVKIPVYAQHVDGVGYGGFTGHVTAASLKAAWCHRIAYQPFRAAAQAGRSRSLHHVLSILRLEDHSLHQQCSDNAGAAALEPDYVAVEPPELIGSGIPVSKANPDVIRESVHAVLKIAPERGGALRRGNNSW